MVLKLSHLFHKLLINWPLKQRDLIVPTSDIQLVLKFVKKGQNSPPLLDETGRLARNIYLSDVKNERHVFRANEVSVEGKAFGKSDRSLGTVPNDRAGDSAVTFIDFGVVSDVETARGVEGGYDPVPVLARSVVETIYGYFES